MTHNNEIKTLDLHGIQHEDVEDLVHKFINSNLHTEHLLSIVTGHSDKMKAIVHGVLAKYDLESLTSNMRNQGVIQVQMWKCGPTY